MGLLTNPNKPKSGRQNVCVNSVILTIKC